MIIVRVELHSAITGKVTEIARAQIYNDGTGDAKVGNYRARTYWGRSKESLDRSEMTSRSSRDGSVTGHRRRDQHVWNLVAKALKSMGYGE